MAEARVKQPFYDPMNLDLAMFSYPVDNLAHYGHTDQTRLHYSYYDIHSGFESAQLQKPAHLSSLPTTPPLVSASNSTESYIPTGSATSGPSIASASSSAMGSPYSGAAQVFHDNWVNTNHGLGLPAAVMNDMFSQEYMGSTTDMDTLYQEKLSDTYVGRWKSSNQLLNALTRNRSLIDSTRAIRPWPCCPSDYRLSRSACLFILQCATYLSPTLSCRLSHSL